MRVPLFWLHDYCDPGIPIAELEHQLTMTGTKVEAVHGHGVGALEHFLVGRVLTAERHPDADRLTVCTVDVGTGDERTIVCGAPNVAAGQIVAVAEPGAVMPDGTKLKRAKLRGVESAGMILAEDEVAIGPDHDGIMVLDPELKPGTPLVDVLPIATDVLELEITPNRPDCLSIYGVAREVHAATGAPLTPPPWTNDPGSPGEVPGVSIEVQDPVLCPRFTARLYEDVQIGPSPEWLKARLTAAGMRPINNVVDITNFAMLATGQPMHAFDYDLVAGGRLVVRRALDGETMTTLDDVERTFDSDKVLLICDDEGPTSIAGIMGGERSEVRETTTRVLMEAATWNGPEHPAHVDAARAALGGVRPVREAAPARAGDGRPGAGGDPHDRADRRAAGRGHRRRRRARAGAEDAAAARRAHRAAARHRRPARRGGRHPAPARVRRRRDARGARRHGARLPARRRHARGRPDRGGRAAVGARQAALHAALAARRRRRARARSSACAAAPRTRWPAPACRRSAAGCSPRPTSSTACASRTTTGAATW